MSPLELLIGAAILAVPVLIVLAIIGTPIVVGCMTCYRNGQALRKVLIRGRRRR